MKKTFLIVLILGVISANFYITSNKNILSEFTDLFNLDLASEGTNLNTSKTVQGSYKIYNDLGIYIAIFPGTFQLSNYVQKPNSKDLQLKQSTEDIVNSGYLFGINSGFFTSEYNHIGLLVNKGKVLNTLSNDNPQATHIFELEPNLSIYTLEEFDSLDNDFINSEHTLIQTGPLVISDNVVQNAFIQNSLNGNSEHFRSLVGYTDKGEVFFISTRKQYSLNTLANSLLTLGEFKDKSIVAINLDGGSSVSMFSSEDDNFNLGKHKKLSYYITVSN